MHDTVITRYLANPILRAEDWPYPVHSVFNAGATLLKDGTTLLLCRVEDRRGISHLSAARSANGVNGWTIDPTPTFLPDPDNHPEELWGVEDPRITFVPELDRYVIAYTAFTKAGPGVAIATTQDFVNYQRLGLSMQPEDKDAAVMPRRFGGNFALIHRPVASTSADMWISFSPDLYNWGGHQLLLPARRGGWWDSNKIGLACPPIETGRGWLMLYHGVRSTAAGAIYRLGMALFELEHPEVGILRGDSWFFGPEAPYELHGDVGRVVFPTGFTLLPDGDSFHLYYGAADTCIALATGTISGLLAWLDVHGNKFIGTAGQAADLI